VRERVDVLIGGDALCRVDGERGTEAEQNPVRLLIPKPPPFNIGDVTALRADAQARRTLAKHLNHIAVVPNLLALPVHSAPCAPDEADVIAHGPRQVIGLEALVDSTMDGFAAIVLRALSSRHALTS